MPAAERTGKAIADHELAALFTELESFQNVLLAVSGGPDSIALLLLAHRWRSARGSGPALVAATVDHRLRPESKREAAAVSKLAGTLGVPHHILVWAGKKPATGVQEAAREARYGLLIRLAHELGADAIVTAHTLDDQAETLLMRMARGSGISGLGGIRARSKRQDLVLSRPLLGIAKARLVATVRKAGINFAEDRSNVDPRFLRPRLRRLAGDLAAEGLTPERLASVARRLARADAALEAMTDELQSNIGGGIDRSAGATEFEAGRLLGVPEEISLRLLGRAIERMGDEGPVELGKLETLHSALLGAHIQGKSLRRTLAGALVSLDCSHVTVSRAPARGRVRRG